MKMLNGLFAFILLCICSFACHKKDKPAPPPANPQITVDVNKLNEQADAGKDSILVTSNMSWSIDALPSWLHASVTSGNTGQTKVIFNYPANTSLDPLTAAIKIKGQWDSALVTFTQLGTRPYLSVNKTALTEASLGQMDSVTVMTNKDWSLSGLSNYPWITADKTSGTKGTIKLHFTVASNTSDVARTATLQLVSADASISPISLKVTQAGLTYALTSFSPANGPIGTTVTLNGTFGDNPVVMIDSRTATITSKSVSQIVFTVPSGATTDKIRVLFGTKSIYSATEFLVNNTWRGIASQGAYDGYDISFVYHNKIYCGLGTNASNAYNTVFKVFDPTTNTWSDGPSLPATPVAMQGRILASAYVVNDTVFMGLGNAGNTLFSDWWKYEPGKSGDAAWTKLTDAPISGSAVAFAVNNMGFIGHPTSNQTFYQFLSDATKGNWTAANTSIPKTIDGSTSTFTINGDVYFVGGYTTQPLNTFYKYSVASNVFTQLSNCPFSAYSAPAFAVNGKGYLLNQHDGHMYQYDPANDTWTDLKNNLPSGVTGQYNVAVLNGVPYLWTPYGTYKYTF